MPDSQSSNQHQQRQRHVRRSTDRDVMQELTRDDTQRDDNKWLVVSRRRSTQSRRTPGQCAKCGESNHVTARCKHAVRVQCRQCGQLGHRDVASWATERNITRGTRRSVYTMWSAGPNRETSRLGLGDRAIQCGQLGHKEKHHAWD